MQAAPERRDPQEIRVPLSDVLIDLSPEGYDESFPADGINLGLGGLSMRSAILPDIGSQMRCRFQSPHDGASVDADCEVVWANDSGPNVGEFGLRFTGVSGIDQDAIERLVSAWERDLAGLDGDMPTVRLELDGVASAIEANSLHRADDVLVVEQPLPFLTIGTGVTEGGRRGVLQGVDLRLEDDTPRLVLTVWYESDAAPVEEEEVAFAPLKADAGPETLADAPLPHALRDVPEDDDAFVDDSLDSQDDAGFDAEPARVAASDYEEEEDAVVAAAVEIDARADQSVAVVALPTAEELDEDEQTALLAAQLRPNPRAALRKMAGAIRPAWSRVRGWFAMAWVRVAPAAGRFGRRLRAFSTAMISRVAPGLTKLTGRMKRSGRTTKRRQTRTSVAPAAKSSSNAGPAPRRKLGRWILLGACVVAGGIVAQIASGDSHPYAEKAEREAPELDPERGDDSSASLAAEVPVAAPEPGVVPADSPYAESPTSVAPTPEPASSSFGADAIEDGQEFTLRLSLAPSGLRGEATDDGIRVQVLGSNALDGARRIAGAHARVAGASILNHGDEAELRLRFTPGDPPAYRVEARSASLVVTIGE